MRLSDNDGFTLIELLIALVISGIISAAMYSAYTSQQKVNQAQDQIVTIQQDLRAGLDMMARELRMAGYDPDKKWGAGFTEASATTVQFTLVADDDEVDNDKDGVRDEAGELKTIRYEHSVGYGDTDGIRDIRRQVDFGNLIVLIENVDRLEFLYTLVNGSQPLAPIPTDLTGNKIRSIQISVLARASEESMGYLNTETYTSASGEDWTPGPDDYFRRRMQVITVDCRNMGW